MTTRTRRTAVITAITAAGLAATIGIANAHDYSGGDNHSGHHHSHHKKRHGDQGPKGAPHPPHYDAGPFDLLGW